MSYKRNTTSIHKILDDTTWLYYRLKYFLKHDASSVNERNPAGLTPLHRVLQDISCSPDVIKLLLHHGADINLEHLGVSPLQVMWMFPLYEKEAVIKALIEGGSDLSKLATDGQSLLCLAFTAYDVNIIIMLIKAGCPMHTCLLHGSTVHCFLESLRFKDLNTHILCLLIEKCKGIDLNVCNSEGRSLLCYALCQSEFHVFNCMIQLGFSLKTTCKFHGSPWLCAIAGHPPHIPYVTKNFVQKFIDVKAKSNIVNESNEDLLSWVLKYCSYEMSAIQLMFDKGVVKMEWIRLQNGGNALHTAFSNTVTNPKIVKFLVDRGADINAVNEQGDIPLHSAIDNFSNLSAIKALLQNGSLVNVVNQFLATPMRLGILLRCGDDVLQLLLNAGAKFYSDRWTYNDISYALKRYKEFPLKKYAHCCQLLTKHYLLDNPFRNIIPLISQFDDKNLEDFVKVCENELKCMKTVSVSQHCTLYQLIVRRNEIKVIDAEKKEFNINGLISVLVHNRFPAYFDVICSTVEREDLKPKLQEITWYAVNSDPELQENSKKPVKLGYDSILEIVSYLTDEELWKMIIGSKLC